QGTDGEVPARDAEVLLRPDEVQDLSRTARYQVPDDRKTGEAVGAAIGVVRPMAHGVDGKDRSVRPTHPGGPSVPRSARARAQETRMPFRYLLIVLGVTASATMSAQRRQPAPEPTNTGPIATGATTPEALQDKQNV